MWCSSFAGILDISIIACILFHDIIIFVNSRDARDIKNVKKRWTGKSRISVGMCNVVVRVL